MILRPILIASLLALAAPASAAAVAPVPDADSLVHLGLRISLAGAGPAAITETAVLASDGPARVRLPFGFPRADSFTVSGRDVAFPRGAGGADEPLQRVGPRPLLTLELGPAARAGDTVIVRCRVAHFAEWDSLRGAYGAYPLARTFVNDADVSIGTFRMVLELPAAYQVRRITASEPAFKGEASPTPPFAVGMSGQRGFASIVLKNMRPGGRARLAIEGERVARGRVPLLAGLVLVLLYLWFFRDLAARPRTPGTGTPPLDGSR